MTMTRATLHGFELGATVSWNDQWWTITTITPRNVRLEHPVHEPLTVPIATLRGAA